MLDDDEHPKVGKQLWFSVDQENDVVHINDVEWKPKGTLG